MEYVYPAVFSPNDDGSITVTYPDLPGCISEGKTLANALYMAQSALTQWIEYLSDKSVTIPNASSAHEIVLTTEGDFVNLIRCEPKDSRAVRRNVSIPKWMDEKVVADGLSLSRVLQDALTQRFR